LIDSKAPAGPIDAVSPSTVLNALVCGEDNTPLTVELAVTFKVPELSVAIPVAPALILASVLELLYGAGAVPLAVGCADRLIVVDPSTGTLAEIAVCMP
jgi:hypothetical protein